MRPIRTKGTEHLQQTQEVTAKIPERCDNAVAALPAISTKSHRFLYRPTGKSFWKRGVRGGRTFFQKGFPPRKLFSLSSNLQASACRPCRTMFPLRGDRLDQLPPGTALLLENGYQEQGRTLTIIQPVPSPKQKNPRRSGDKKDPLALRAARGSRTIFGSGLLSHMTLCSIIGDGELNFRVRNGVGCTLSSMATKEIWQIY